MKKRGNTGALSTKRQALMICPECSHVFQGRGWTGIDGHWRAHHEGAMKYEAAWELIKADKYQAKS